MNTLPDLRQALIDAGYRQADLRRGGTDAKRGAILAHISRWLLHGRRAVVVILAVGSAAAVVVVALSSVRSPARPQQIPTPGGHRAGPSAPPPQQPNLSDAAARDITQAAHTTIARDRACSASAPAAYPRGHAPAALMRSLSVLRRPATSADRLPSWLLHGNRRFRRNLYVADSRLAATVDGARFYIVPMANVLGWRLVPSRCDQEQRVALTRRLAHDSPATRRRLLADQRRYLGWKRYEELHPEGVTLTAIISHPSPGSAAMFTGGGGFTFADIGEGHAGLGSDETPNGAVFHQLVPDGVERVTVRFAGHAPVAVPVKNNLYAVREPGAAGQVGAVPAAITWLSADGHVIEPLS